MRTVVVGASSGLGRSIGIGLAQQGFPVALMARRLERLERAAKEAGEGTVAIECDVTDPASCEAAIESAADHLGGIDALVYCPAYVPLFGLKETSAEVWRQAFDTNVTGAALITAAAVDHLQASHGRAVYLSSVSASLTPPWPGLGTYAVTKAALDKLVEAWRGEHPTVGFTRLIVGDCMGGQGESMVGITEGWDAERAAEFGSVWIDRGFMAGSFVEVEHLIAMVGDILRSGASLSLSTVTIAPRPAG